LTVSSLTTRRSAISPFDSPSATRRSTSTSGLAAHERGAPIGPWTGLGVTFGWALASLVVALWLVRRQDA